MSKIFIPTTKSDDWKQFLAEPDKQWRDGYSAKSLAERWEELSDDFPKEVKKVFINSGIDIFRNPKLLFAFPEFKVSLPGGQRASQNDIFVVAKAEKQLIAIAVEGKVSEPFGDLVTVWKNTDSSEGKEQRLNFLLDKLNLINQNVDQIRYQLLHRTVSAILMAEDLCTENALMLVHSFSPSYEHFDDYYKFLELFKLQAKQDKIVGPVIIDNLKLYFGWVKG